MGLIPGPALQTAWRELQATPLSRRKIGLELLNQTNADGTPLVYWADTYAECFKLAEQDGWKF